MKKKIKLAIFVDGDFIPSYDGASNRFHYLSRFLSKNGIDLIVFHGYRGWSDISLIKKEPFKTYVFSVDNYYNNLELIASILIKEGVNIIQFDNLEPILLQGVRLAQLTGAKLVSEMHYVVRDLAKRLGADSERLSEIKDIEEEVGKSIDHLICLSEQDKPLLVEYMNQDRSGVSVVPSGVDCEEIQYFGPDIEARNIIFLGNLYFKPNEDAVRVIKEKIYPKLKDFGFTFTIGGDCPLSLRSELSDDKFTFTGTIPDLNDLFKNATYALAPISEGTGMRIKLLNYLAAGIPVVTTSTATDGFPQKQVLIIEDDYSKYADIILKQINEKEELKKLSGAGYDVIKESYDWNVIAKKAINVYQKILGQEFVGKASSGNILKTKEPVWLQEAITKDRFKLIQNLDLPKEFSYCVIENSTVYPFLIEDIIALEGMAGAGKTTFIDNYVRNTSIKFLPQLEIKNERVLSKDDLQTSKVFLMNEKEKSLLLDKLSVNNKNILVDRTFLTTLAYCYARSKKHKNNEYEKLLNFYEENKSNITFPTKLILLDVKSEESIKRRSKYINNPSYSNWFDGEFLDYMREFYKKELQKFIKIKTFSLDTSNMTTNEVEDELKGII